MIRFVSILGAAALLAAACSAPGDDMGTASIGETAVANTGTGYSKPADGVLKETLTAMQYRVTQRDGTEPPYRNAYWDNKAAGLYVDVVSGEPLFSSTDKYKSGTGWPSFTKPLDTSRIVEKADVSLGMRRVEIRSRDGDSHLGHLFDDGPAPTGLRYCINSAALKFIPAGDLESEGYGQYGAIFKAQPPDDRD